MIGGEGGCIGFVQHTMSYAWNGIMAFGGESVNRALRGLRFAEFFVTNILRLVFGWMFIFHPTGLSFAFIVAVFVSFAVAATEDVYTLIHKSDGHNRILSVE